MKRIHLIILFILSLCISGCVDTYEFSDSNQLGELANGKLRLMLNLQIPKSIVIETKAGSENSPSIQNAYVLVFEAPDPTQANDTDRLLQIVNVNIDPSNTIAPFTVVVDAYKGSCRVKVVANLDAVCVNTIESYVCLGASSTSATTIADFKNLTIPFSSLYEQGAVKSMLPLANDKDLYLDGINAQTSMSVKLLRVYARFTLSVNKEVSQFSLETVQLHNGYKSGRYCFYTPGEWTEKTANDFIKYPPILAVNNAISPVYLFENLAIEGGMAYTTTIIIQAKYKEISGYYKLYIEYGHIVDGVLEYNYDILRNVQYDIVIRNVKNYGYPTLEEALASAPQNDPLEYDVVVDDSDSSNDIIYHTSGYSIGSSNSEVWIYAESSAVEYVASTLTFDVTNLHPSIDFKPSRSVTSSSKDITITNVAEILTKSDGEQVPLKIKVQNPGIEGVVTIQYGGLRKDIKIAAHKMLKSDWVQAVKVDNVIGAKYENTQTTPWLRVSKTNTYPQGYTSSMLFDSPISVYFVAPEHKDNVYRQATPLYFFRQSELGTLKVIAVQTYGAAWENDVYYRESAAKSAVQKRANTILIPNKEVRNYRITGTRLCDYYNQDLSNLTAEICWADFNLFDPNPFEPHQLIEVQNIDGGYQDVRLRVRKYASSCQNGGNGNVVWGLKSADGKWMWTWHIWLSDLVAEYNNDIVYTNSSLRIFASSQDYKTNFGAATGVGARFPKLTADGGVNKIFLDRNMGAKTSSYLSSGNISSSEGLKHYGLYYQWGRKDPLPGSAYLSQPGGTSSKEIEIFTAKSKVGILYGNAQDHKTKSQLTMIQSINMPLLLAHADYKDWCSDMKINRWNQTSTPNSKGKKTIYDPSPYGWRLNWGTGNELANTGTKEWKVYADLIGVRPGGVLVDNKYWFPASGGRDYFTGNYNWIGVSGAFWTGSYTWDSHGALTYFELKDNQCNYHNNYHIARTYACPLRPILDER